jgi:SAM-dependent methyltransferase
MTLGQTNRAEPAEHRPEKGPDAELPDYYPTVAEDVIAFCGNQGGRIWVDLGTGPGGLGLALLEKVSDGAMVLMDPNVDALRRALDAARKHGVGSRTVAVIGSAESIPLPDESVDLVVSRGSFYFWRDRAQGLREIWRILRPGGRAMIGGGLGSTYPQWARQEFIRRRRESAKSPEEVRKFAEARSPETFRRLATEAGLPSFEVVGEGGLTADDPKTGIGIWLRFTKEAADDA